MPANELVLARKLIAYAGDRRPTRANLKAQGAPGFSDVITAAHAYIDATFAIRGRCALVRQLIGHLGAPGQLSALQRRATTQHHDAHQPRTCHAELLVVLGRGVAADELRLQFRPARDTYERAARPHRLR